MKIIPFNNEADYKKIKAKFFLNCMAVPETSERDDYIRQQNIINN